MVEEVKNEAEYAKLPIIMLTTEGAKDLIVRAMAAGANGWIVKSFKPAMLVAAVSKLSGLIKASIRHRIRSRAANCPGV